MAGLEMKYFILKPKGKDKHAEASRKAMRAYADHIYQENEQLAKELLDWAKAETMNAVFSEEGEAPNGTATNG